MRTFPTLDSSGGRTCSFNSLVLTPRLRYPPKTSTFSLQSIHMSLSNFDQPHRHLPTRSFLPFPPAPPLAFDTAKCSPCPFELQISKMLHPSSSHTSGYASYLPLSLLDQAETPAPQFRPLCCLSFSVRYCSILAITVLSRAFHRCCPSTSFS